MATTPQPPPAGPTVTQRYQPPQGAIPIAKLKRVGVVAGICLLAFLTIWGTLHKPAPVAPKAVGLPVLPTTPGEVDSQQAELTREMEEARRAAQQAELAKQRAEHVLQGDTGPRNAQPDAAAQLRAQLALEDLRRQHQAAYASTIAFASQGSHTEPRAEGAPNGTTQPVPASTQLPQLPPMQPTPAPSPHLESVSTVSTASTLTAAAVTSETAPPELPAGTYRLDEGTILETILLNRLDGEFVGPVIAQVSADVYSRAGLELLIPKGSRLLGEAKDVNSFDQRRLAILFHRLILPNGRSISLDKFRGLDQIGETGVVSKVDHHYLEIFGTSLALGAIGGLTQIGNFGGGGYNSSTGFRIGFTERMGASSEQVLSKFLNKLPTIKVLEGTRIKVILTNDLNVEAY